MKPIMHKEILDYNISHTMQAVDFIIAYSDITTVADRSSDKRIAEVVRLRFCGLSVSGMALRVSNLSSIRGDVGVSVPTLNKICHKSALELRDMIELGAQDRDRWILDIPKSKIEKLSAICKSIAAN